MVRQKLLWAIEKKHGSGFPMGVISAWFTSKQKALQARDYNFGDSRVQRDRQRIEHQRYDVRSFTEDEAKELIRQGNMPNSVWVWEDGERPPKLV